MKDFIIALSIIAICIALFFHGCKRIINPQPVRRIELVRISPARYEPCSTETAIYSVNYTVENTGETAINGWQIAFQIFYADSISKREYGLVDLKRHPEESSITFTPGLQIETGLQIVRADHGKIDSVNMVSLEAN